MQGCVDHGGSWLLGCLSMEIVTKGPKDLSLKIPTAKTTGELLENMPSAMAAFDSHLDNAIRSSSMLQEVQSIVIDNPHIPPISNAVQDTSSDR
ncbi:uncharacterized protein [Physcomitrium patens]|uniref:uncharacterized protein isoform X2 n=1 Tax=Physcomitrium patens TaxID=3218 RepID=UPI003CCD45ED